MKSTFTFIGSKAVARLLSTVFAVMQVTAASHATDLSDTPMAVKNTVAPNVLFVVDDSGSMGNELLFDTNDGALWWHAADRSFVGRDMDNNVAAGTINVNKTGDSNATWKKYIYLFPNGHGTDNGLRTYADEENAHLAVPPTAAYAWVRSHAYNRLYYNPALDYKPWKPANDATSTTTYGNASPTAAKSHPKRGTATLDLTSQINSNASNWTFRMYPGMLAPSGASYRADGVGDFIALTGDTTVPDGHYWDVQIPYFPATYYVRDDAGTFTGPDGRMLKRYEIKSGQTFPGGRSYEAELQNFANWFTYYRKRQQMFSAAVGQALDSVRGVRGGVVRFNNLADVTMHDFNATDDKLNQRRLIDRIYDIAPISGTPTRAALNYAGQQLMRTNDGAPITHACQFNAAFVVTDGYASNNTVDTIDPANFDGQTDYTQYPYNRQYSPSAATITHPYQDSFSKTLADIAMKYYSTALRTGTNFPAGKVPVNAGDTGPGADRNPNLHMNTYALGLGVKGSIFGTGSAAATNPYTTAPVWPDPFADTRSPASVDDLWHATLNGRGTMFTASDPGGVRDGINAVINAVIGKVGSASAVAVANANVVAGDNAVYLSSYNSGNWSGDLNAYPLDLTTGLPDLSAPLWTSGSAQRQLDLQTATSRKIVTYGSNSSSTGGGNGGNGGNGGSGAIDQGIPFQFTTLSSTQQGLLNSSGATDGAAVLAFLRGDRSAEGTTYRTRAHLLGDLVNAEPVIVREPLASYGDEGFATFKSDQAARTKMIFQGGNDGMLHAFNAASGAEEWAYIPNLVLGNLNKLSRKEGFTHQYYVDGTPFTGDLDFKKTDGATGNGADWRTILVGGLGKGGRGYYALDVTNPASADETGAAAKVLWEFPNSGTSAADKAKIGYSFGKPVLVKTKAKNWVVLATSGYNNGNETGGDGQGYLFVLNPRTGEVIETIPTGAGSSTDPSGLAQISAYAENGDTDATIDFVYGGDLKGNVWRFDLSGNNTNDWGVTKLATLTDGSAAQPITTAPALGKIQVSGVSLRMVYIGTGQYLGDSDVPGSTGANANASQTQTMYGLVDDLSDAPLISTPRTSLQLQTFAAGTSVGTTRKASASAVDYSSASPKKGWYIDLPSAGERINTDPALGLGVLSFTSNIPSTDPCTPGGSSWFTTLDYKTGGYVALDGTTNSSVFLGNVGASRVVLSKLPSGKIKGIVHKTDGSTDALNASPTGSGTTVRRISWRELPDQ